MSHPKMGSCSDAALLQSVAFLHSSVALRLEAASQSMLSKSNCKTRSKSYVASLPGDVCYIHITILPAEKAIPSVPL